MPQTHWWIRDRGGWGGGGKQDPPPHSKQANLINLVCLCTSKGLCHPLLPPQPPLRSKGEVFWGKKALSFNSHGNWYPPLIHASINSHHDTSWPINQTHRANHASKKSKVCQRNEYKVKLSPTSSNAIERSSHSDNKYPTECHKNSIGNHVWTTICCFKEHYSISMILILKYLKKLQTRSKQVYEQYHFAV